MPPHPGPKSIKKAGSHIFVGVRGVSNILVCDTAESGAELRAAVTCSGRQTGASHRPVSTDRKAASMHSMLATASSSGTGAGRPSRIAREKRSPWIVY